MNTVEVTATEAPRSAQRSGQSVGTRVRSWAIQPHLIVGYIVFTVIVVVAVMRNRWIISEGRVEDGDFGVNSILIDKALRGHLLVGNYSRVGFNHPGPALLYIQAAGQSLFLNVLHLVPRPYNAHVLSIILFCAAMASVSAAILARRSRSMITGLMVLAAALMLGVVERGSIVSTSFPEVYIWPYMLLSVAVSSVISREPRDLPWAFLGVGLLCHGHVSFVLFSLGFLVVAIALLWRRRRTDLIPRAVVLKCAAIAFIFAFPFVLNMALHWPGELGKYWRYSRSPGAGGHSWISILRFIGSFWSAQGTLGFAVVGGLIGATSLLVLQVRGPLDKSIEFGLLVTAGMSTVLLVIYARRGIDDLRYHYVAEFYYNAPTSILLALGSVTVGIVVANRRLMRALGLGVVFIVVVLSALPGQRALYPGANWVLDAARFLDQSVPAHTTRIMRFPLEVWPGVAGIVEQSRRTGDSVCIAEPALGFLFNKSMICDADQRVHGVIVDALPPATTAKSDSAVVARYASPQIILEVRSGP